jgi:kynurenine formamidase
VRFIDLSHTISNGLETYPGLPGPIISDHLSRATSRERYAPGTEFQIGRIDMVANTGTYIDTPFHRFADGHDLSALALERVAFVAAVLVDATGPAIDADAFAGLDLAHRAVLVRTGWDAHWGTPAYGAGGHPHLTAAAAQALVEARVAVVGIDSVNIDGTSTGERPVHTALLTEGIPIVEHLRGLEQIPNGPFTFTAVPVKVAGMGTFPVRAFATID